MLTKSLHQESIVVSNGRFSQALATVSRDKLYQILSGRKSSQPYQAISIVSAKQCADTQEPLIQGKLLKRS